jgi:hypothetical protein
VDIGAKKILGKRLLAIYLVKVIFLSMTLDPGNKTLANTNNYRYVSWFTDRVNQLALLASPIALRRSCCC